MPAAAANAALAGMAAKGRAGQDTRCSSGRSHRPGCAAHQWGVTLPRLCSARCTSCVTGARARARAAGGYDSPHARAAARAEGALAGAADAALAEQAAKARLALAADHFNRDHRKGFQFLQARPPRAWALLSQVPRSCRAPPHPRPQAGRRFLPGVPPGLRQRGLPAPARRRPTRDSRQGCRLLPGAPPGPGWRRHPHPSGAAAQGRAAGPAQALGLLGEEPDAAAVARFLRHCPGLSKVTIGELLGENEDFYLEVLDAFTDTFDFAGAPA